MKPVYTLLAAAFLAGCNGTWATDYDQAVPQDTARMWHVHDVTVTVPSTLTTTEEDSYTPDADIVWHGDEFGDRAAQVAAILTDGIEQGSAPLRGRRGVDINVELVEFHAVTPIARMNAPSAVHNISYKVQVVDAATGAALTAPELIRADLEAYTGIQAFEALARGDTQKKRITEHLRKVTAGWLGIGPDQRKTFSTVGR